MENSSQLLVQELRELGLGERAYLGRRGLAVLEHHERGDAAHAVLERELAVLAMCGLLSMGNESHSLIILTLSSSENS